MPLFLLMGGEIVIAFLLARIAIWMLRGRSRNEPLPPPDPGPGRPLRLEECEAAAPAVPCIEAQPPELRRAA